MKRITAFFAEAYAPPSEPLFARLAVTADRLVRLGLVNLVLPEPASAQDLIGLHSPEYLDGFLQGREPHASRQGIAWSPAIRDAALWMLGGQLAAARHALQEGIAMNIARGFHHAVPQAGSGFCPLNGLALIAHAMPTERVFIIDCDEHGGNGTEEFAAILPNLYNVSIFGTRFGCRGGERSWDFEIQAGAAGFRRYREALRETGKLIGKHKPSLLVYQAGADCHEDDPKSRSRLTTQQLFERDLIVFEMAGNMRIPIMFLVAGGYQDPKKVATLNANTVRAARLAFAESTAHRVKVRESKT